jgi:hypothetical protein
LSGDDDMAWLEVLAGRADAAGGDDAAAEHLSEAAALRELIRTQATEPEIPPARPVDPQRENELIARARAAGLLPTPRATPARHLWTRHRTLAAAAVIVAAIGVALLRLPSPPTETLRGGGTVHLRAPDPVALKRQLSEELRAAGAHVTGFERLGRPGIDVDLPQPVTPRVRRILEEHQLPVPADGELTVEFDATGRP